MARDITKLHPDLQKLVDRLQKECLLKGLKIGISECLRTVAEQDALYAQGRTKPGNIVTNAKGSSYSSMHQWGVAFDFYRNDGRGAYYDTDGFFTKVGQVGKSIGLEWGGDWKSIVDKPHLQLPDWGSTPTKLKALYSTPDKFMAIWGSYPEPTRTIYYDLANRKVVCTGEDVKWVQEKLNRAGYKLDIDGRFGPGSDGALRSFQSTRNLVVDGRCGPDTRKHLKVN